MSKTPYQFDFREMENRTMRAYLALQVKETDAIKHELYISIKEIAYAIMLVGNYSSHNLDYEAVSYEYGVYMFERLQTKKFVPKYKDRFPWQNYISLNIQHIIHSKFLVSNDGMCSDICDLLADNHEELTELLMDTESNVDRMTKQYSVKRIYDLMRMFYPEHEIERLYPISKQYLTSHGLNFISAGAPPDVTEFIKILVAVSKRVIFSGVTTDYRNYKKRELDGCIAASLKSTLFMASIVNADFFPTDLLLACDLDSLLRLITISGGSTIRIPTTREFESLIGATMAASEMIISGSSDTTKAKWDAKYEHGLVFSNRINMNNFISKILDSCKVADVDQKQESNPLIYLLLTYIKSLNTMSESLIQRIDGEEFSELIGQYDKLVDLTLKIIQTMQPHQPESITS